jgi:hypothetical protein
VLLECVRLRVWQNQTHDADAYNACCDTYGAYALLLQHIIKKATLAIAHCGARHRLCVYVRRKIVGSGRSTNTHFRTAGARC